MKTKTKVKAGGEFNRTGGDWVMNHNQGGATAKTRVKAGTDTSTRRPPDGGGYVNNHNQTARH